MNKNTAIFTLSRNGNSYNITSKAYNLYNRLQVPAGQLFDTMAELTDTFNNVLEIAILFEVE